MCAYVHGRTFFLKTTSMIRLLLFCICPFALLSQPIIEWENNFGTFSNDFAGSIIQIPDGGYVFSAWSVTPEEFPSGSYGGNDAQVYKIDKYGNLVWQKHYGGSGNDVVNKLFSTSEGHIIAVGFTASDDHDVPGNKGMDDAWVLELDTDGKIISSKTFGGSDSDGFSDVLKNKVGGWELLGSTYSADGDFYDPDTIKGSFILKTNNSWGTEQVYKFSPLFNDYAERFVRLGDGGYMMAGTAYLGAVGDIDKSDVCLTRIANDGEMIWSKTYGGEKRDFFEDIQISGDKIIIVAESYVSPYQGIIDNTDYWVFNVDLNGSIKQSKKYGGPKPEWISNVISLPNDELLLIGSSFSDEIAQPIGADIWLIKVDNRGDIVWQTTFGGYLSEISRDFCPTLDGGFILLAETSSSDGDVGGNLGGGEGTDDIWVVKLAPEDLRIEEKCQPTKVYPNPITGDKLTVAFQNPTEKPAKIELFDAAGRFILSFEQEEIGFDREITIDLPAALSAGIYLLKVFNCNNEPSFQKLVKIQ